jgi:hypothetical protein
MHQDALKRFKDFFKENTCCGVRHGGQVGFIVVLA